ncbi:hypothetical protein DL93DRAFT_2174481 [Clavulina sp. PMI_390]|nr:hypothetical protein DL93DRAFT_2174481 [Clavulina sp. PMI_390]
MRQPWAGPDGPSGPHIDDGTKIHKERELFEEFLAGSQSSPELLPQLQLLWYETTLRYWMEDPVAGVVGLCAAIADAFRQLLSCRPTLSIKLLPQEKNEDIPEELIGLTHEFGGRFFVLNRDPPNWAE